MLTELIKRYPKLEECKQSITNAGNSIIKCYENGGKILICGNGGSAADSDHIVGELMKGFLKKRPLSDEVKAKMKAACSSIDDDMLENLQCGLPAVSLPSVSALNTAFCNDVDPRNVFAQSTLALGKTGDILIAISTSGNSDNVVRAAKVAKAIGLFVIGMTGKAGGKLLELSDICICVPECETFRVQELHLPTYHYICAAVEDHFYRI